VVSDFDTAMMRRALFHAARGAGRTTPNPMVGAVVVSRDGVVVGQGWHQQAGEPHAEVHALDEAGGRATGGTLYVTLEPCCHVGRTGPCTRRVIGSRIARVVAAMTDPDPRVSGRGFAELRTHGIDVECGVEEAQAMRLNEAFRCVGGERRPLMVLKVALSLDGCVAAHRGARTAVSGHAANRRSQWLRAGVDAIAVGSETVLVDDPLLTVRQYQRVRPLVRVVFDRRLRTPPAARLFTSLDAGPVVIVTAPGRRDTPEGAALASAGATLVEAGTLGEGVAGLVAFDVSTLLVEGGPTLHRALVEAALVDRLHVIVAPHRLGADGIKWIDAEALPPSRLTWIAADSRGVDTWLEADVQRHR
jgi:diaminohydroxyphosphoribosylaminopyrimidine deaminase/5-amino-6-(5-phosphoribosylamino)uracil reductase